MLTPQAGIGVPTQADGSQLPRHRVSRCMLGRGPATAGPLGWILVLFLLAPAYHREKHLLAWEHLRGKGRGLEEQLTSLSPPRPLLPMPSGEAMPHQNSLSQLNNKRKNFSGPVAAPNKGVLHFQKGGAESVSRGQG